jgi:hypothetical protein
MIFFANLSGADETPPNGSPGDGPRNGSAGPGTLRRPSQLVLLGGRLIVVSASGDGTIRFWDAHTNEERLMAKAALSIEVVTKR